MNRVLRCALGLAVIVGLSSCGSDESERPTAEQASTPQRAESTPAPTESSEPTTEPTSEATTEATTEATPEPEPTPEPLPPNLGTQEDIRNYFDDEIDDIDWEDAPTPRGRPRLLGLVSDRYATIELFGQAEAVDEIAYQVAFDGTNMDINFDRALPMIRMAQEYASEEAAMFVGSELDGFTYLDAVPQQSNTKKFGDVYVRVLGIDVINVVNLTMSIGHRPTRP